MFCSRCGHPVDTGARFCSSCGEPIAGDVATSAPHQGPRWWRVAAAVGVVLVVVLGGMLAVLVATDTIDLARDDAPTPPESTPLVATAPGSAAPEASDEPAAETEPGDDSTAVSEQPPADFSSLFADVRSGVVKIQASTCDGTGIGTGFLVGPDRVVTAAHVVEGAVSVVVESDAQTVEAEVLGVETGHDLAVLEVSRGMTGHVFDLETTIASAGSPVAVIGHPLDDSLTITQGVVSRIGQELWPELQMDASVNPGNSGGPVLDQGGDVVGVVLAKHRDADGVAFALRSDVTREYVEDVSALDVPVPAHCDAPLGPDTGGDVPELEATDDVTVAIATTLANYFGGINSGDYALAYDQFSPRLQSTSSYDGFADGVSSSYDFGFEFKDVRPTADGAFVWLEFVSIQDPALGPDGEGCTEWSLDYRLVWDDVGALVIDRVRGHDDTDGHVPCD